MMVRSPKLQILIVSLSLLVNFLTILVPLGGVVVFAATNHARYDPIGSIHNEVCGTPNTTPHAFIGLYQQVMDDPSEQFDGSLQLCFAGLGGPVPLSIFYTKDNRSWSTVVSSYNTNAWGYFEDTNGNRLYFQPGRFPDLRNTSSGDWNDLPATLTMTAFIWKGVYYNCNI